MIALIILATVISTVLGGLFAIRFKDKLHLTLGFSAGAILGVALFDLLPESIKLTNDMYDIQAVMILVAFGFCAYMLIDRLFSVHSHGDDRKKPSHKGKVSAIALILHSLLDGFSIGLAFKISNSIGLIVALAVLVHKFSDGISTVSVVIKDDDRLRLVLRWLAASALAPVVGVCLAYFLIISEESLGLLLAVFVGLFLYISTSELIPESHHHHPTIWTTLSTIAGVLVIFVTASLIK